MLSELGVTLLENVSYVELLESRKNLENKRGKKISTRTCLVMFVK